MRSLKHINNFWKAPLKGVGRDSSVGIGTSYRLDGPRIESWWGWDFPHPSRQALPASYTMGTGSFLGIKRPGRGIDHPPTSSAEVKERVELYLLLWAFVACSRMKFLPLKSSVYTFSSVIFAAFSFWGNYGSSSVVTNCTCLFTRVMISFSCVPVHSCF